jgi:hypothetical protein
MNAWLADLPLFLRFLPRQALDSEPLSGPRSCSEYSCYLLWPVSPFPPSDGRQRPCSAISPCYTDFMHRYLCLWFVCDSSVLSTAAASMASQF